MHEFVTRSTKTSSGVVVSELDESNNRIDIRNALLIISLYSEDYNDSCLSSV
jgi:hypothetical protein